MSNSFVQKESIIGYITNISNENKKKKFYVKFSMCCDEKKIVDGWVFSNKSGILTCPLGVALSNALARGTGLRLFGTLENNKGSLTFRMQVWNQFQSVKPSFELTAPKNDYISVANALTSIELINICVGIIDIRPPYEYSSQEDTKIVIFILIGDESGTAYLMINELLSKKISIEKSYVFTKVRSKRLNGSRILSTTIDTGVNEATNIVDPNIIDVTTTLEIDLTDIKTITTNIIEIGAIDRSCTCLTCKGDLTDVDCVRTLLYCTKCHRHVLKRNIKIIMSTTIMIHIGDEKMILRSSGSSLDKLFSLVGVLSDDSDANIASAVLSCGDLSIEYSEIRKEIISICYA